MELTGEGEKKTDNMRMIKKLLSYYWTEKCRCLSENNGCNDIELLHKLIHELLLLFIIYAHFKTLSYKVNNGCINQLSHNKNY